MRRFYELKEKLVEYINGLSHENGCIILVGAVKTDENGNSIVDAKCLFNGIRIRDFLLFLDTVLDQFPELREWVKIAGIKNMYSVKSGTINYEEKE